MLVNIWNVNLGFSPFLIFHLPQDWGAFIAPLFLWNHNAKDVTPGKCMAPIWEPRVKACHIDKFFYFAACLSYRSSRWSISPSRQSTIPWLGASMIRPVTFSLFSCWPCWRIFHFPEKVLDGIKYYLWFCLDWWSKLCNIFCSSGFFHYLICLQMPWVWFCTTLVIRFLSAYPLFSYAGDNQQY